MIKVIVVLSFIFNGCYCGEYWMGSSYWNERYKLGYPTDWKGWWSWWKTMEMYEHYDRKENDKWINGCSVNSVLKILTCKEVTEKEITIKNHKTFTSIAEDAFKDTVIKIIDINTIIKLQENITQLHGRHGNLKNLSNRIGYLCVNIPEDEIMNSELQHIPLKTFTKLKELQVLVIAKSKIRLMPDISQCSKLEKLDLYDNNIQLFRHNYTSLPKSLKQINLISNDIYKFPEGYFDLPVLEYIGLAHNQMKYFPGEAFRNNFALRYVGADANHIKSISQKELEPFVNSNSFVHLNLSNNIIDYIAPKAFKQLKSLKILELHNNSIETLPKYTLWRMPKLLHLDMNKNKIQTLTSDFIADCPELKNLFLHSQKTPMEHVYFDALKNLSSLTTIYLGSNALKNFPHPAFSEESWNSLSSMHLDLNQIQTMSDYSSLDFPPSAQVHFIAKKNTFVPFKTLPALSLLNLGSNKISEIKEKDLELCTSLSVLYLSGNELQEATINEFAFQTTVLSVLYFSSQNPGFQYVPKIFLNNRMPHLSTLYLNNNKITFIDNGTFLTLNKLTALDLSGNRILVIEDNSFPQSLQNLYLGSNKFRFTNFRQFNSLTSLKTLDLAMNRLKYLPDEAFQNMPSLNRLELSSNQIGRLLNIQFKNSLAIDYFDFISNDVAFIEDGTFANIRRNVKTISVISFQANKLSRLPQTDFWNVRVDFLYINRNRITRIAQNAFTNFSCSILNLQINQIERIESNGFHNINCKSIQIGGRRSENELQYIEKYAFNDAKVTNGIDLSYHHVKFLPSYAFYNVRNIQRSLWVNNGKLELINTTAFDLGNVPGTVDLSVNKIKSIKRKIFSDGTSFNILLLHNNELTSIDDYAFNGSVLNHEFNMNNNKDFTVFPAIALAPFTKMKYLKIRGNQIKTIPSGSLGPFTELKEIDVSYNKIEKLQSNLFQKNNKIEKINVRNNELKIIEDDAFHFEGGVNNLKEIEAQENPIDHVPKFKEAAKLEKANVWTVSPDFIGTTTPNLRRLELDTINLQCDCYWYNTIVNFLQKTISNKKIDWKIWCGAPASLKDLKFDLNSLSKIQTRKAEFICTPANIRISAPSDYTIQIDYDYPSGFYPGSPSINFSNDKVYVDATCQLEDGSGDLVKASVMNQKKITIFGVDKVLPGQNYRCNLVLTYDQNNAGNKTSARSPNIAVATIERKGKVTLCANGDAYECLLKVESGQCISSDCHVDASNALSPSACDQSGCCRVCYQNCTKCSNTIVATVRLNITYYDYRVDDIDFGSLVYNPDNFIPKFVPSPYESWLIKTGVNTPAYDSFSDWFRSSSSRNLVISEKITLSSEGNVDPVNNKQFFTFWDADYWPVNGKGYKAQGQKDCTGNELLNFGFSDAIRTGMTFTGVEHFQFGGGEDLWVFINNKLVLSIINQFGNDNTVRGATICKTFQLVNATGSGYIVPRQGIIDVTTKTCNTTKELWEEKKELKLQKGVNYGLEVFHVEKFRCWSEFLFTTSGVSFITPEEANDKPIPDYVFEPPEDSAPKAIVGMILVSDLYQQASPYKVTIESGNEEERFKIVSNTTQAYQEAKNNAINPSSRSYPNVTLNGRVIIICPNNTGNATATIAKTSNSPQVFENINTPYALIVLQQPLDYEATPSYLLHMKVEDKDGNIGSIVATILVGDKSDNCPIIKQKTFSHFSPSPPLQLQPLLTVQATDLDSGENGRISFFVQEISKTPTIDHRHFVNTSIWENTTIEYTVRVMIYAVDNGVPSRGDFFPISMSYSPNCDKTGKLKIDETSGQVHFVAPGMTTFNPSKFRYGKSECYECTAGHFCPGNSEELPCVEDSFTKHYFSYGFASRCSPCPEGMLCHDGIIRKCAENTYVKCNNSWCPESCLQCPVGTYCYEGIRQECRAGTFSNGKGPCELCPPGSFSNSSRSSECTCCPSGFESTYAKTNCRACHEKEFSDGECNICQTCTPPTLCGCNTNPCFRGVKCTNIGVNGSLYECGDCPEGFTGNGVQCQDIDECVESPCSKVTQCINISPGYHCTGCVRGYTGNAPSGVGLDDAKNKTQVCTDINECENGENICDPNSECINTPGSYECGKCNPGFVGDGYVGCKSGDYCASGVHNCHENATCIPLGSQKFHCVCKDGFAGNGVSCELDHDYDGITSFGGPCNEKECKKDICPYVPNGGQEDVDIDTLGDVCDEDDDDDYYIDTQDNCQFKAGRNQTDTDGDGVGDICDNCLGKSNADQKDRDGDGKGDICDDDIDGDGLLNGIDKCIYMNTTNENDMDGDGIGNACDNCYKNINSNQQDDNQSGFGNACDGKDSDGDSIPDDYDNCPKLANAEQSDKDDDGKGDLCDNDKDNDGVIDSLDNCVYVKNNNQKHTINYDMEANPVGIACLDDYDGDGSLDKDDMCPYASNIYTTSFLDYSVVDLASSTSTEPKPRWRIRNNGRDIEQVEKTYRPSILLGSQRYSEVEYSGVFHVNSEKGIDYFGIVFGYQNNKKLLVAMWRHKNMNYLNTTYKAGIKGLQIKVVDSDEGPGDALANALWYSDTTDNKVTLLWQDPKMDAWKHRESYIFKLEFRSSLNRIRMRILQGETLLTDSGYLYDKRITGGRLGVYTHGQWNVIWSRLTAKCLERLNRALSFNGNNSLVTLPTMRVAQIEASFVLMMWMKIDAGQSSQEYYPLLCNSRQNTPKALCLYIKDKKLNAKLTNTLATTTQTLSVSTWYHVALRYDGQGICNDIICEKKLVIFLNGNIIGSAVVASYELSLDDTLYIGYDGNNHFKGEIDEVAILNVCVSDSEVKEYMKLAGLIWPIHQRIVTAFYNVDQPIIKNVLEDVADYHINATLTNVKLVESTTDFSRYELISLTR